MFTQTSRRPGWGRPVRHSARSRRWAQVTRTRRLTAAASMRSGRCRVQTPSHRRAVDAAASDLPPSRRAASVAAAPGPTVAAAAVVMRLWQKDSSTCSYTISFETCTVVPTRLPCRLFSANRRGLTLLEFDGARPPVAEERDEQQVGREGDQRRYDPDVHLLRRELQRPDLYHLQHIFHCSQEYLFWDTPAEFTLDAGVSSLWLVLFQTPRTSASWLVRFFCAVFLGINEAVVANLSLHAIVGLVEEDGGHHGAEEQREATREALCAREAAARRPVHHREPDVPVRQVLARLLPEQVAEVGQLFLPSHRNETIDLKEIITSFLRSLATFEVPRAAGSKCRLGLS